jgi:hypothetical protein
MVIELMLSCACYCHPDADKIDAVSRFLFFSSMMNYKALKKISEINFSLAAGTVTLV